MLWFRILTLAISDGFLEIQISRTDKRSSPCAIYLVPCAIYVVLLIRTATNTDRALPFWSAPNMSGMMKMTDREERSGTHFVVMLPGRIRIVDFRI